MKKIIVLSLITSASLFAFNMNEIKGEIIVGGGMGKSNDSLVKHGSDDKDFDKSTAYPLIMGNVEIGDFELSVGQENLVKALYNVNDNISVYVGIDTEETWKNPFVAKNTREKTDIETIYGGIDYQALDWLKVGYSIQNQKVKVETVHTNDKRSGNIHTISASIPLPISDNIFNMNTIEYELGKFDGKGNDYNAFTISSELEWQVLENTTIETKTFYKYYSFSNKMNHFNKKRDEKTYGISAGITQDKLFGYEDFFGFIRASYDKRESNINFYDAQNSMASLGLGYKF